MAHADVKEAPVPLEYEGHIVSQPRKELAVDNAKYVKACTELHLANKGIEFLWGFERFVNLEVLWINDNKLTSIDALDNNFRIKKLYAHNNRIRTLRGSIEVFKFLEELVLSNNQLSDLTTTLETLSNFAYIKTLDLFGNPCTQEQGYRLKMIYSLPSLHVLDRHVVTDEERLQANRKHDPAERARRRAARKGAGGGSATGRSASGSATGEFEAPLSSCERLLLREVRTIKGTLAQRDREEKERMFASGRRTVEEPKPLQAAMFARPNSARRRRLAAAKRRAAAGGDSRAASRASERTTKTVEEELKELEDEDADAPADLDGGAKVGELTDWELYRLQKVFDTIDRDGSGTISRGEFKRALTEAQDMGKKLAEDGSNPDMKALFEALDVDGNGQISVGEFFNGVNGTLRDPDGNLIPALCWDELAPEEANERSDFYFKQAADIQKKLLPMPPDDPRRPHLTKEAFRLTEKASRLRDMASGKTGVFDAPPSPPPPPKTRRDMVGFLSTVRVRKDQAKMAAMEVPPEDSSSDSDTDDESPLKQRGELFDRFRKARKGRKPRMVVATEVTI
mmetsp:Transcript_2261/g.7533  ORF Transcript_2261/g.7533 Transcript_2261/m.7533 type:complete len:568 (-) Transcript_2261:158-1861(-)